MNFSVSKLMLAGAVTGVLVCAMTTTALAADLTAGVGTVTASALKLRAEASTSSECLVLLAKKSRWLGISFDASGISP